MKIKIQQFLLMNLLFFNLPLFVNAQETTQSEETITVSENEKFPDAQTVLEMLQKRPEQLAMTVNILNASEMSESEYTEYNRSYLRDHDYHYLVTKQPDKLTNSVLIETDNQEFKRSLIMAEDLAKYSAEALNDDASEYIGTETEEFYIFAQSNLDKIRGVYVQDEANTSEDQKRLVEFQQIEEYFVNLLSELLKEEKLVAKIEETEQLGMIAHYVIDESIGKKMAEISEKVAENSITESMTTLLKNGYVGTLVFSLKTGNITLSIGTPNGSEVLEVLLGIANSSITPPEESKIMTIDEMGKIVGVNLSTMMNNENE